MKNIKSKVILTCTARSELTEFNKEYNQGIKDHCDHQDLFVPKLECLNHSSDSRNCKYLSIKTYKGHKP